MRIVQVIDSLDVGGAERMAVNYANALSDRIAFSGLIATRLEGNLKNTIERKVGYLFLNKKGTFDLNAIFKLRSYCRENRIDFIHAHSTSYFISVIVKILYPRIGIIWHDHNGMSEFVDSRKPFVIRLASNFFEGIIVVNHKLQNWAKEQLHTTNIVYIPNFTIEDENPKSETKLNGNKGARILCLANLRPQKDHFLLLDVAEKMRSTNPEWTFHLVGKDFDDLYSKSIKERIADRNLSETVFVYGTCNDTTAVILQSDICVLTSKSEGLPVSLLEFGLQKKPVVVTAVGEIPDIITHGGNGLMVEPANVDQFHDSLLMLVENDGLRITFGEALYETVFARYSVSAAMDVYLQWINTLK